MNKLAQIPIGPYFESHFGTDKGFGDLISIVLANSLVLAGVILLFLMVLGGMGMIAGAGNQKPDQVAKGQQTVTMALVGFIIVFAAYWILLIIEKISGINILNSGL
ncbi:hypothetical protein HY045_04025 [Candidatus Woesebacteria bacterium]|nr:hypothetical protein [Candidatus Woesebacteria bacterium]